MTVDQINKAIMFGDLSVSQLDSVYMALKFARNELRRKTKRALAVGDSVKFVSSRTNQYVIGTVKKINRKFIIVHEPSRYGANLLAGGGTNWRVPAEMLELATEQNQGA